MGSNIVQLPRIAKPTIERVLQKFLAQSDELCKPPKSDREMVIELFTDCINNYGHIFLSEQERKFFEKNFNMNGAKHREFCEIFGPSKLADMMVYFVDSFLIQKTLASATFLKKACTTMKILSEWLSANGYLNAEEAKIAAIRSANASKNLPKAEKAHKLLWDQAQATFGMFGANKLVESGYMDITKIQPGKIWVTPIGEKEIGPLVVPISVTNLLQVGWEINLGLAKSRGKLEIAEIGCIYPH